jgi:acetyl esterase/lipase
MDSDRRAFLRGSVAAVAAAGAAAAAAQEPWGPPTNALTDPRMPFWPAAERFPLWPGTPPGAPKAKIAPDWTMNGNSTYRELWVAGIQTPEVHVFRAPRSDGSALLSIPGGGYRFLSVQNEGLDVAEHFNADRTTVFVLTHRLPGEGWANRATVPLSDAQRAMRLIRHRAKEFHIDPDRLGVIGFSAGGHLAADLAVSHAEQVYAPVDTADRLSARPAYLGLVYAITSLLDVRGDGKPWDGLAGPGAPEAVLRARSPVLHVSKDTPPTFLVQAMNDPTVLAFHSFRWIQALSSLGIATEGHFLSEGGHGFGLHLPKEQSGSQWPDLFSQWLRKHGG